jgi:hypothetical protein
MHFVTRQRVHVDRIATAWAIRRFVDPGATFEFVTWRTDPRQIDGVPFDIRGAELSHRGGRCTLEALIGKYELTDDSLRRMARIIRAADLPQEEPAPSEAAGVLAIFDGIRDCGRTDEERLEHGFVVCEALYAYCQHNKQAGTAL